MPGLSFYIKRLRSRYPRMLRVLTGNPNQSSKAIPFFQPSYMPYQVQRHLLLYPMLPEDMLTFRDLGILVDRSASSKSACQRRCTSQEAEN